MTDLRVAFRTLGCKLNQLESESMADRFAAAGARLVPFDEGADLFVVNTCTVTGKAEQKARRTIRQALASSPDAVVLVTGCYAQMDGAAIAALDPRAVVVPGDEKSRVLELAGILDSVWQGHGDLLDAVRDAVRPRGATPDRFAYHPDAFAFHSRPGLKIQDGCDNRCSYCRVCLARGASVSLAPGEVLARVRALEAAGKAEVVLTGVNLSQYRDPGNPAFGFPELLAFLHEGTTDIAFRISSYEPDRIDASFLAAFALPRVRPHIHLALQSGSSTVLARMARPYDAARALSSIAALRSARVDPFIGADIIAGFPGESDAEFAETIGFCRAAGFAWIHAFPFSPRPGTPAWDMRPHIPERVAGERVAALGALAHAGKRAFAARRAGRIVPLVLEQTADDSPGFRFGTSADYLKIAVRGVPGNLGPGAQILAEIDSPSEDSPTADIPVSTPHGADLSAKFAGGAFSGT